MAQNTNSKRDSWIKRQVKKYNTPDFLPIVSKNPHSLDRGIVNLFRDIANFNVSVEEEGPYFLNKQFLDRCIDVAYSKYFFHYTNMSGVMALGITDPNIKAVYDTNRAATEGYKTILDGLTAIRDTGDLSCLIRMAQLLRGYRFNI